MKAEQIVIKVSIGTPPSNASRIVSVGLNICLPLQITVRTGDSISVSRAPLKIALAPITGSLGECVSLVSPGGEFVSFSSPPPGLELSLQDELSEKPMCNTDVIAHLLFSKEH